MEKVIAICGHVVVGKTIFANELSVDVIENMQEVNQFDSTPTMAINNYFVNYPLEVQKSGKELRRERRKLERKYKKHSK